MDAPGEFRDGEAGIGRPPMSCCGLAWQKGGRQRRHSCRMASGYWAMHHAFTNKINKAAANNQSHRGST